MGGRFSVDTKQQIDRSEIQPASCRRRSIVGASPTAVAPAVRPATDCSQQERGHGHKVSSYGSGRVACEVSLSLSGGGLKTEPEVLILLPTVLLTVSISNYRVFGWRVAERSGSAPAAVWMGNSGSGAAHRIIYLQYAGSLRPSEFEGQSRFALVPPLLSPSVSPLSRP
jgi:hypothetical protein